MRSERSSKLGKRVMGIVALCLLLLTGGGAKVDEAGRSLGADQAATAPAAPPALCVEREMILSVARRYRRTASQYRLEVLADTIYEAAVRESVDPLLVASIIAKESSFRDHAVSSAGAMGLMQIRPTIARDLAQRRELGWHGPQSLGSPSLNVRYGILYYKELVEDFDGDHAMALTAYNFGPTRVRRQLRERTYAGSDYASEILSLYHQLSATRATAA
jgi:soluble lytic murein transglycosylase-like protein